MLQEHTWNKMVGQSNKYMNLESDERKGKFVESYKRRQDGFDGHIWLRHSRLLSLATANGM